MCEIPRDSVRDGSIKEDVRIMRCASCGLPLSPARTHCPRCGTPAKAESKVPDQTNTPGSAGAIQQMDFAPAQTQWPQQSWGSPASSTSFPQDSPFGMHIGTIAAPQTENAGYNRHTPLPDAFASLPAPSAPPVQFLGDRNTATASSYNNGQQTGWGGNSEASTEKGAERNHAPQLAQAPVLFSSKQSAKMRLTVSGSCVFLGGLLLVFVYFMARGLPGTVVASGSTKVMVSSTPSVLPSATPVVTTTPAVSPTVTYPGQKYIDSAQTASTVNTYSAQATQPATTFKTNQLVYVTFAVHTGGVSGAACLTWYLNHTVVASYGLGVRPTTNAYSYARLTSPGAAYVEIYWASTRACTDKVLAQHVDFTVSA